MLNGEIAHLLNDPLCLRMLGHVARQNRRWPNSDIFESHMAMYTYGSRSPS